MIARGLLQAGGRVVSVLRLLRRVRSRHENFWMGQTLVSCSSHLGLDWVAKATQVGRLRRSTSWPFKSRWMRVIMKPRQPSIFPSVFHTR